MVYLQKSLQGAEQFAKELFYEDPGLSVDSAAREIDNKFPRSLTKDAVSRIRAGIRQKISSAVPEGSVNFPKETPRFENRPRLVIKSLDKAVDEPQETDMKPKPKTEATVTTEQKKEWLTNWLIEHPMSTIKEARTALLEKFTEALGTSYIASTIKDVRGMILEDKRKEFARKQEAQASQPVVAVASPEPASSVDERPLKEIARELADFMKKAGIRSLKINADDTVEVEASVTL